ncbi:transposase [Streptomyces sp. MP131-18]|uniref:IS701 family transposase n=1 Tax=Streptomyces sp. MP131-18 TaxID=1857892 RepID=UPI00097C5CDA|nr:transposase [Streptomyces sp. MP131-18]ONK14115.1 transposase-like protein [Streptomyces sp. MP131-18]
MYASTIVPRIIPDAVASFADGVFSPMPRVDQRRWAEVYLRGLLLVEGKKTVRKIADSILSIPAHQSLQQFINQSPWEWEPVRALLARHIQAAERPMAWVLARTAIPKRGDRSVGVERQFLPEAGRTLNCQIGVGAFLANSSGSIPVNWRILLPRRWGDNMKLRKSAYIPDGVGAQPEWRESIDMVSEMDTEWGLARAPVIADIRHLRHADDFITTLMDRGFTFALEVDGSMKVLGGAHLSAVSSRRPALQGATGKVVAVRDYVQYPGAQRSSVLAPVRAEARRSRVVSSLVRIHAGGRHTPPRVVRLLSEIFPLGRPARFWITNLADHRVDSVMSLARLSLRSKEDMQKLEDRFGLRDFEGRSFRGWHHHMTMVSAAYAFDKIGWGHDSALCSCN